MIPNKSLGGKILAVDGNNILYQFLSSIRMRDGSLLHDSRGRVTSHLNGLLTRSSVLLSYGIRLIFIFDGKPPVFKYGEIQRRRDIKNQAEEELLMAEEIGDLEEIEKQARRTSRLGRDMVKDAQNLLDLLGIPWIKAPSEGEAQASYMVRNGSAWAINSRDYDSLIFGSPRVVRRTTASEDNELLFLSELLSSREISIEQLIDASLLIGTDYNRGINGLGPVKSIKMIKKHGDLDNIPSEIYSQLADNVQDIREFLNAPPIDKNYSISFGIPDDDKVVAYLCEGFQFSEERVRKSLDKLNKIRTVKNGRIPLDNFLW
jgi:flap endonuclease-1